MEFRKAFNLLKQQHLDDAEDHFIIPHTMEEALANRFSYAGRFRALFHQDQ